MPGQSSTVMALPRLSSPLRLTCSGAPSAVPYAGIQHEALLTVKAVHRFAEAVQANTVNVSQRMAEIKTCLDAPESQVALGDKVALLEELVEIVENVDDARSAPCHLQVAQAWPDTISLSHGCLQRLH